MRPRDIRKTRAHNVGVKRRLKKERRARKKLSDDRFKSEKMKIRDHQSQWGSEVRDLRFWRAWFRKHEVPEEQRPKRYRAA